MAFAGIGRPQKFFDTLKTLGVDIADAMPFPDHHTYTDGDVKFLRKLAADNQATLVTTTKDFVRLRPEYRRNVETLPVGVDFDDELAVDKLLEQIFEAHNGKA